MDAENNIWSRALEVERTHGNLAQTYVAGRIDASRHHDDAPGEALWTEIGSRMRALHLASALQFRFA